MTACIKMERNKFTLICERAALLLLVASAFILPISVSGMTVTYLLAWILVLISGQWAERWQRFKNNKAAISFIVLLGLFIVGLLYTTSPWSLAWHDLQKRHWLLMTPFFIVILTDNRWRQQIINAFLIAMLITLLLSYLKFFGIDLYFWVMHKTLHGANVFYEHIVQTFFLDIAAFIVGYRFLFHKSWRFFYLILFLLMTINILFMCDSGTGDLVYIIILAYLLILRFSWKGILTAVIAGILLLVTAFLFSHTVQSRVQSIQSDYQHYYQGQTITSIGLRMAMWKNAIILIEKRPWFGYGTGGIRTAMQQNLTADEINTTQLLDYVENIFLNFTLEFGFFGLAIFILLMITQFITCFSLPHEYKHLMLTFLISYLAGGFLNSFFVSFCEAHLYSLIAAVCFSSLTPKNYPRC